ncbi:MAG: hypothetical protein GXO07_05795 [Crenarchaeota archaeon]|nr:hypothetical protein [Thermoproteota archaeon]
MDPLSHLAVALFFSSKWTFVLGALLPDADALGNFLGIPFHRGLLHAPALWLLLYPVRRLRPLALGALLHVLLDAPFGPVPLYPLPLSAGGEVFVYLNGTELEWGVRTFLSGGYGGEAVGHVVNAYGVSLLAAALAFRSLRGTSRA